MRLNEPKEEEKEEEEEFKVPNTLLVRSTCELFIEQKKNYVCWLDRICFCSIPIFYIYI